eukprot:ANDGO_04933.mRNA.1 NEP1-interacting protein 1
MIVVLDPRRRESQRRPLWKDPSTPLFYLVVFVFFLFLKLYNLVSWPWAITFFPLYIGVLFLTVSLFISYRREIMRIDGGRTSETRAISFYVFSLCIVLVQSILLNVSLEAAERSTTRPFPVFTLFPLLFWSFVAFCSSVVWILRREFGSKSQLFIAQTLVPFSVYVFLQVVLIIVQLFGEGAQSSWKLFLFPSYLLSVAIILAGVLGMYVFWKESDFIIPSPPASDSAESSRVSTPDRTSRAHPAANESPHDNAAPVPSTRATPGSRWIPGLLFRASAPKWIPEVFGSMEGLGSACAIICGLPLLVFFVLLGYYLDSKMFVDLPFVFLPLFFSSCILTFVSCFRSFSREDEDEESESELPSRRRLDTWYNRPMIIGDFDVENVDPSGDTGNADRSGVSRRRDDSAAPRRRGTAPSQATSGTIPLAGMLNSNPILMEQFLMTLHRAMDEEAGGMGGGVSASLEAEYFRLLLATIARAVRVEDPRPAGVQSHLLDMLPSFVLDEKSYLVAGQHMCNICLSEFAPGDEVRTLPCFHFFHKSEIDEWLSRNNSCPLCKRPVDEAELARADEASEGISTSATETLRIIEEAQEHGSSGCSAGGDSCNRSHHGNGSSSASGSANASRGTPSASSSSSSRSSSSSASASASSSGSVSAAPSTSSSALASSSQTIPNLPGSPHRSHAEELD